MVLRLQKRLLLLSIASSDDEVALMRLAMIHFLLITAWKVHRHDAASPPQSLPFVPGLRFCVSNPISYPLSVTLSQRP